MLGTPPLVLPLARALGGCLRCRRGHRVVVVAPSDSRELIRDGRATVRAMRSDPDALWADPGCASVLVTVTVPVSLVTYSVRVKALIATSCGAATGTRDFGRTEAGADARMPEGQRIPARSVGTCHRSHDDDVPTAAGAGTASMKSPISAPTTTNGTGWW